MLGIARLFRRPKADTPNFGHIPLLPGGVSLAYPNAWRDEVKHVDKLNHVQDVAHGVFQRSVTNNTGSAFLIGLPETEIKRRYPMAKKLEPIEKVGRVSISPKSAMLLLRNLFGDREVSPYVWDLFYLEQAGNELGKPGPFAMIPDWVEDQLKVETIASVLCGMQRHDATVGAAIRALMQQDDFSFALIDTLKKDIHAEQGKLSLEVSQALGKWSQHASEVVVALRDLLDNPPIPLQYLPAVREAQKGQPGVYYFPEEVMGEIAPVLDAIILAGGAGGDPHHWYVSLPELGEYHADGLNAASRLGAALWQSRESREAGFGPAVSWDLGGEVPEPISTKASQHRCVQGSAFLLGYADSVIEGMRSGMGLDIDEDLEITSKRVGVCRVADSAFQHLNSTEEQAAALYGHTPENASNSTPEER